MSTTTSKPTLADAIRAVIKAHPVSASLDPAFADLRAALPAAEAADAEIARLAKEAQHWCDKCEAADALAMAADLRRNSVIYDSCGFAGEWVAVPADDFNALSAALRRYREGGTK